MALCRVKVRSNRDQFSCVLQGMRVQYLRWKQRTGIKATGPAIVKVRHHFKRLSTPELPDLLRQLKAARAQQTQALQSKWVVPKSGTYFRKKLWR